MGLHLQREIDVLKKSIVTLSTLVEESVNNAVNAVQQRDEVLARSVIDADRIIDSMEIDVEEECCKALALHQPVASDLRFIVAVLKINNDLERVGDMAVNIAERALMLAQLPNRDFKPFDFNRMVQLAGGMLKKSLDALVNYEADLAGSVCKSDDDVDEINRAMYLAVIERVRKNPQEIDYLLHMLSISRNVERIADHATNIAEDVIYMVSGEIIRHHSKEDSPEAKQ
ncbi:MAG: phosphate signaling complex protein PhoU [Chitinivibrionales bacterium]|nr:phosphate signaling complex protein PhoU [Chitinivibrionales bacterium]